MTMREHINNMPIIKFLLKVIYHINNNDDEKVASWVDLHEVTSNYRVGMEKPKITRLPLTLDKQMLGLLEKACWWMDRHKWEQGIEALQEIVRTIRQSPEWQATSKSAYLNQAVTLMQELTKRLAL